MNRIIVLKSVSSLVKHYDSVFCAGFKNTFRFVVLHTKKKLWMFYSVRNHRYLSILCPCREMNLKKKLIGCFEFEHIFCFSLLR